MRRFLLASVATVGLSIAALPALAQDAPAPATPPITTPAPDQQEPAQAPAATPSTSEDARVVTARPIEPPVPEVQTQTATPDASVNAETPTPTPSAEMESTAPLAGADAQAMPAPVAQAAAEPQAEENAALAVPTSATNVCEARTTSVHFGARRSALSRENQNAIQYATDAASVCDLQTVTIVDSADGRVHSRRAEAIRATLVRQGVSEDRITIAQEVNADPEAASTGRVDVRMTFAGAATGGSPATAAAAPAPMVDPATPSPAPSVTPQAPDTMTPPPADGGPAGEEVTDPTPST